MQGSDHAHRLIVRGYGPLMAFMAFFAGMVTFAPTVPSNSDAAATRDLEDKPEESAIPDEAADDQTQRDALPETDDGPEVNAEGQRSGGRAEEQHDNAQSKEDGAQGQERTGEAAGLPQPCQDRDLQVPGDPYSPPCMTFSGQNPGATHRGVTEEEIIISARTPDEPGFVDELANLADADISDTQEDVRRTIAALEDYFNERFEFYGRRLRFEFFDGTSTFQEEAQNRGHEEAQQDALTAADEIGAFAELTGATEPYASALAQQGVISVSGIHFPRGFYEQHAPLKWSTFTDCSTVVEAAAEWTVQRLYHRQAAHAGDSQFRERERDVVALGPENPIYQQCVDDAQQVYDEHGEQIPDLINYTLDISTMSNQAANIIAQLQDRGVTTVQAFVDPVMAVFLTARAAEQDYHPEWIVSGAAYMDQDVIGQLQHQDQWARAFGISFAGEDEPQQASLGYHAYRQVRDDEPAFSVNAIYQSMYLLAIGVQGAGPDLTPETFQQGMYDYPGGRGPYGTWHFGPGNHTATQDFREIYWDPDEISTFNNEPGSWMETDPDIRLERGEIPEGPPRLP